MNSNKTIVSGYLFIILVLFVVMYSSSKNIKLTDTFANVIDNQLFQIIIVFVIIYYAHSELGFMYSLIIFIIFLMLMNILHSNQVLKNIKIKTINTENFSDFGPPISTCDSYDSNLSDYAGIPFYPMMEYNKENAVEPLYEPNLDLTEISNGQPKIRNTGLGNLVDNKDNYIYNNIY